MSVQDFHLQIDAEIKMPYDGRLDEDFDPHSPRPDILQDASNDEDYATQVPRDTTEDLDPEDDLPLLHFATLSMPAPTSDFTRERADESTHIIPEIELVVDRTSVEIEEKGSLNNENQDQTSFTTLPSVSTPPPSIAPSPSRSPPSSVSTVNVSLQGTESPIETRRSEESESDTSEANDGSVQANDVIRPHAPFVPTVCSLNTQPRFVRVPVMNQYVESEAGIIVRVRTIERPSDNKQLHQPSTEATQQQGTELDSADIYPPLSSAFPRNSMDTRPQAYALVDSSEPGNGPTVLAIEDAIPTETTTSLPTPTLVTPTPLESNPYLPWNMGSMGPRSRSPASLPPYSTTCQAAAFTTVPPPPPPVMTSSLPRRSRSLHEEAPGTCLHCCLACFLCLDAAVKLFMVTCCCCGVDKSVAHRSRSHDRTTPDGDESFYG